MFDEQKFIEYFENNLITNLQERDPCKPLIYTGEGDMVKLNPDYDPEVARHEEIERRRNHLGTSFFLNFDPLCHLHQLDLDRLGDNRGVRAREDIARQLSARFLDVFVAQCPGIPASLENSLRKILRVEICPYAQSGFNNGEVYMWLPGQPLKEDFVFQILRALYNSLKDKPILANIDGTDYEVQFYGWGFRYY